MSGFMAPARLLHANNFFRVKNLCSREKCDGCRGEGRGGYSMK